jgi:hypothetical protein
MSPVKLSLLCEKQEEEMPHYLLGTEQCHLLNYLCNRLMYIKFVGAIMAVIITYVISAYHH